MESETEQFLSKIRKICDDPHHATQEELIEAVKFLERAAAIKENVIRGLEKELREK